MIDEIELIKLAGFDGAAFEAVTYQSTKDGIEITKPTYKLERLIQLAVERGKEQVLKGPTPELDGCLPLVLYFGNNTERDEFVEIFKEVKPHAKTKKL